jgi:hypothetical protein
MAESGVPLAQLVERLAPKKRGKGRLRPAPSRTAIPASTATAYPSGADIDGIESPLTEQADTRTYHATTYTLTSSSGFLVLEYAAIETMTFSDAVSREVVFEFDDTA